MNKSQHKSEDYNSNLHKNAIGKLYEYGRRLRQTSTDPEQVLWKHLRSRKFNGLKFRWQHPLDKFIADFYCNEKKLVIELDGRIHDNKEATQYDGARTYELKEWGITVIRFRNEEVLSDVENVLKKINEFVKNR